MRAGRSILGESMRVLMYRRAVRRVRFVAIVVVGVLMICMAAAHVMLMQPFDGLLAALDTVAILWGMFVIVIGLSGLS